MPLCARCNRECWPYHVHPTAIECHAAAKSGELPKAAAPAVVAAGLQPQAAAIVARSVKAAEVATTPEKSCPSATLSVGTEAPCENCEENKQLIQASIRDCKAFLVRMADMAYKRSQADASLWDLLKKVGGDVMYLEALANGANFSPCRCCRGSGLSESAGDSGTCLMCGGTGNRDIPGENPEETNMAESQI